MPIFAHISRISSNSYALRKHKDGAKQAQRQAGRPRYMLTSDVGAGKTENKAAVCGKISSNYICFLS